MMITFGYKCSSAEEADIIRTLEHILPEEYNILLLSYENIKSSHIIGESQFKAEFRVDVRTEDETSKFMERYSEKSWTTHNKFKGDKRGKGVKTIVSGIRKCHHAVKRHGLMEGPKRPKHTGPGRQPNDELQPRKNTDCPAMLNFALSGKKLHTSRGELKKTFATSKEQVENHPLLIKLNYTHNHSIHSANALKYGIVSDETVASLTKLFEQDRTPSSALAEYKRKLLTGKSAQEKIRIMADRRLVPSTSWVSHYHRKYRLDKFGPEDGPDAYALAKQRIDAYNEKNGKELAKIDKTEDGDVMVAICDEFSQRVHENVPQAGDIVLVDATSNLDRHDTKLFHFICPTPAGGLPLGSIITTREDGETIEPALKMLKEVMPDGAFFHRGPETGPKLFMTDDCAAERKALKSAFPGAILLLCVFHLLQALWRWLWNSDHKVTKIDRPPLFTSFKSLVYAPNDNEYSAAEKEMLKHDVVKKYPQFIKHVKGDLLPRKEEWSLTTRFEKNYTTHNVNTTNYAEVSFRITKENQFNRIKAHNLADLLDIILDDSEYYVNRCIDIGNNRTENLENQKSRYLPKSSTIDAARITPIEDGLPNSFLVPSEEVEGLHYEVNMDLGLCECPMGMLRGPCKHKHLVGANFSIPSPDVIPSSDSEKDSALRAFYHFLGTGTQMNANWYRPLAQPDEVTSAVPFHPDIFNFMRVHSIPDEDETNFDVDHGHSQLHESAEKVIAAPTFMVYDADGQRIDGGDSDESEDDTERISDELQEELNSFTTDMLIRLRNDPERYKKPMKYFLKNIKQVHDAGPRKFIHAMYTFGADFNTASTKGRRKNAGRIGINSTHKSRRLYKARGSGAAPMGRPSNAVRPRKRGSEPVAHILPAKQRKIKNPRSLSKAVAANRAAEKKH